MGARAEWSPRSDPVRGRVHVRSSQYRAFIPAHLLAASCRTTNPHEPLATFAAGDVAPHAERCRFRVQPRMRRRGATCLGQGNCHCLPLPTTKARKPRLQPAAQQQKVKPETWQLLRPVMELKKANNQRANGTQLSRSTTSLDRRLTRGPRAWGHGRLC